MAADVAVESGPDRRPEIRSIFLAKVERAQYDQFAREQKAVVTRANAIANAIEIHFPLMK